MTRHVACPLCGADDAELHFAASRGRGRPRHKAYACTDSGLADHGPIVRCRRCGMCYNDPQPEPEPLLEAYAAVEDPQYLQQRRGREVSFSRLARRLSRLVPAPARLLDVGCYCGVFLEAAASAGYTVRGIEPCRWAAAHAERVAPGSVHVGPLESVELEPGSFQLATMWDVIEHLPDPRGAVARIAHGLAPGGVLALSTHVLDSWTARAMGTRYPFLMDMHLVHFTRATLTRLCADCGLEVEAIEVHSRVIMLDYLLDRVWHLLPPVRPLLEPLSRIDALHRVPVPVYGAGLVNVYARKR